MKLRIEVDKGSGKNYFYTGTVKELDKGLVRIDTVKGESLIFRKEQIMERFVLDCDK